jgi:hypothetical protein
MRPGKKRFINFLKSYFKENASHFGLKFTFLYGSQSTGMEDFKIFGLNWQRMLIEKNLGDLKHA